MAIDAFYTRTTGGGYTHLIPSNFYEEPMQVDGLWYQSNEHFYQSSKTFLLSESLAMRQATTPGLAKKLGQRCTLRSDWEEVKIPLMRIGLEAKFRPNSPCGDWRLAPGDG